MLTKRLKKGEIVVANCTPPESNNFARVLDSVSGTQLHRFEHNKPLHCVALSSKHNVLACVGRDGTAQLWDTESYRRLGQPFGDKDGENLDHLKFS